MNVHADIRAFDAEGNVASRCIVLANGDARFYGDATLIRIAVDAAAQSLPIKPAEEI